MSQVNAPKHDAHFPPQYYPPYPYRPDDEISLIDLGKILYKRIHVFIVTFVICVLASLIVAQVKPTLYHFQTVIEMGVYPDAENQMVPIESETALVSRVESASISSARRTVSQDQSVTIDQLPNVSVDVAESSGILVLSSQIKNEPQAILLATALHQEIVAHLLDAHSTKAQTERTAREIKRKSIENNLLALDARAKLDTQIAQLNVAKSAAASRLEQLSNDELRKIEVQRLQRSLSSSERELQSLRERETNLRAQIERQPEKESLLKRQLERAESDLSELRQSRQRVINTSASGATQLSQTLLLIDSQINSALNNVRDLENALHIRLPQENSELRSALVDLISVIGIQESRVAEVRQNLREYEITRELQINQAQSEIDRIDAEFKQLINEHEMSQLQLQAQLDGLNHQINRIENSQVVVEPGLTISTGNKSTSLLLALGALLGLMLGVMAAFMAEFIFRLKESLVEGDRL